MVAGKSGTAEFSVRDARAGCRSTPGSSASRPRTRASGDDPNGFEAFADDSSSPSSPSRSTPDTRQRGDRDREVLPAAPLRHQEGLPVPFDLLARQLLRWEPMGVAAGSSRARRAGLGRAVGRRRVAAFDLQLAIYAVALVVIGLLMAFTNSRAATRRSTAARCSLRGLMWPAIAIAGLHRRGRVRLPLAARPSRGRCTSFNLGLLVAHPRRSATASAASRAGSRSSGLQFQFTEVAKILMIVVLANYLGSRQTSLNTLLDDRGRRAPGRPAVAARAPPARPGHVARLRRDPGRDAVHVRREPALAGGPARSAFLAAVPIVWTYVLRDYQKAAAPRFLDPRRPAGRRLPAAPVADRGRARAAGSAGA